MAYGTNGVNTNNAQGEKRWSFCELSHLLSVTPEGLQQFMNLEEKTVDAAKYFFNMAPRHGGVHRVGITAIGCVVRPDEQLRRTGRGASFHFDMPLDNVDMKLETYCEAKPATQGDTVWVRWTAFDNEKDSVASRLFNALAQHPGETVWILATGIIEVYQNVSNGKSYMNTEATLNNFRIWRTVKKDVQQQTAYGQSAQQSAVYGQPPQQARYGQQPQQGGYNYMPQNTPRQQAQLQQPAQRQYSYGNGAPQSGPAQPVNAPTPAMGYTTRNDGWGPEDIQNESELPF